MIQVAPSNKPIIREVKVPFMHTVGDEIKTEEIRVRYRSLSIKALKEQKAMIAEKGDDAYVSDTVFAVVEELPDLVGTDKKPLALTLELFEEMDLNNLKAIKEAIDADSNPSPDEKK